MRKNMRRNGVSRRIFLGGAGSAIAATALSPALRAQRIAEMRRGAGRDVIVVVMLRGGADGLTMCVPHGDLDYYAARGALAVPQPGMADGAVDLDGTFGLAPGMDVLEPVYQAGDLAIVDGAGSTDETRSHFDAFLKMEFGIPEQPPGTAFDGWLARHLQTTPPVAGSVIRGIALADLTPQTLAAAPSTLPIPDLANFGFPGNPVTEPQRRAAITAMYDDEAPPLGTAALDSMAAIDHLAGVDFAGYVPSTGAVPYPTTDFGTRFMQTAALIKGDLSVEVVMLELGHWDLHNALGPTAGDMRSQMDELGSAMRAFYDDMAGLMDTVTVVVLSEFGRRIEPNASDGLDHGHGNCMWVMGENVAGGQVIVKDTLGGSGWAGLTAMTDSRGDLHVTTDYRDVVSEILSLRGGNTDLTTLFPNYTPPVTWPGVIL